MTPESVREEIDRIRAVAHDDERAHGMEDDLLWQFVVWCANTGTPEVRAVANEVLSSQPLPFSRWCA